ncbi:MAG: hypothetical protein A3B96_00390 [Candidatus Spechtbacteria bacterium RIFCSPHIGHO2_02_FULL_43_15b]|uniref:Uncharacterized protein n=1 Tax=Candidatus Spechtbacteria bacterium RIFCSPHIGHO2_01_FULL_43_30 TaxID=1802158 RepID=A0A1G2H5H1_9BACT|nr:MAG: hypothetical protein A2827_00810 [Candidatus Spechtbacteria bacterium RIFCSPHIGHO2_01_FULL_43_30]OGZ59333.1 MAG: hypothetical protein A3B96_00390 [Candidatus Spechtbacteria bacterium RIFCSPHIGHO2_02_FULL_43_15b]
MKNWVFELHKNMAIKKRRDILHIAIIGALLMSFGASFDAWWHVSMGRDSFFALPHLFIHSGVFVILGASFWAWRKQAHKAWKNIFLVLLLIPLSLPFDEIWHYFLGKESVESVLIVWSPPHILLFVSAITALFLLTRMLHRKENMAAKQIFGAILLAVLLNLAFILTGPFFPFSPFAVIGFYGAAITSFVMSWVFFRATGLLPHVAPAFLVATFSIILQSTIADSGIVYASRAIGSFPYIPGWILVLSQITSAVAIDTQFIKNYTMRGLFSGIIGGLILYVLSLQFTDPAFHYTAAEAVIAVVFAGLGGALAGYLHSKKPLL